MKTGGSFSPFWYFLLIYSEEFCFSSSGMQLSKKGGGQHFLQVSDTVRLHSRGIVFKTLRANSRPTSFLPSLFLTSKS